MTNSPQILDCLDSQHERARVRSLEWLAAALKGFVASDDAAEFSRLFSRAQAILELDDLQLARFFRVSRPTIGRWARGRSAPHPLVQAPVFGVLTGVVAARLKLHRLKPFARLDLDLKMRAGRPVVAIAEESEAPMPTGL